MSTTTSIGKNIPKRLASRFGGDLLSRSTGFLEEVVGRIPEEVKRRIDRGESPMKAWRLKKKPPENGWLF